MHEITVPHKQYQMRHALGIHNHHIFIKACMNIINYFFFILVVYPTDSQLPKLLKITIENRLYNISYLQAMYRLQHHSNISFHSMHVKMILTKT